MQIFFWQASVIKTCIFFKMLERDIHKRLETLLLLKKFGGHITKRDDDTLIVSDCSRISDQQILCLKAEFPNSQSMVITSTGSISNWILVVRIGANCCKLTSSLCMQTCVHAILYCIVAFYLSHQI